MLAYRAFGGNFGADAYDPVQLTSAASENHVLTDGLCASCKIVSLIVSRIGDVRSSRFMPRPIVGSIYQLINRPAIKTLIEIWVI